MLVILIYVYRQQMRAGMQPPPQQGMFPQQQASMYNTMQQGKVLHNVLLKYLKYTVFKKYFKKYLKNTAAPYIQEHGLVCQCQYKISNTTQPDYNGMDFFIIFFYCLM